MTSLAELLQAVSDELKVRFAEVPTVEALPRLRGGKVTAPALLVELADATSAELDPGTGEVALVARLEARVVFDRAPTVAGVSPDAAALDCAAAVAHAVYAAGRFGLPVGPARDVRLSPDHFRPDLAAYAVWLVEWAHDVRLGANVWELPQGILPTEVWLGWSPEIGVPHEPDYEQVAP